MRSLYVSAASSSRIDRARRWLAQGGTPRDALAGAPVYVVTASALAATRLLAPLVGPGQARLHTRRLTLDALALELARPMLIERGLVPLTRVAGEALAAHVLDELEKRDVLGRFARVRARPGMPNALARTLSDLALARAGRAAERLGAHAPELAVALTLYREALQQGGFIDRAGVLELAAEAPFDARAQLLLLDVPLHHRAEQHLACALLKRSASGIAVMPAGDDLAIDALCRELELEAEVPSPDAVAGPLARVQSGVFEAVAPGEVLKDRVQILSAPGEGRECVEATRVLLDAARAGTPFERMAVLMRRAAPYSAQLQEALGRAGVPAFFAEGTERPDPSGRALLALLRCKQEGLSASALSEYLSLDLLPSAGEGDVVVPRRFERLLRRAHVIAGRERFARRLHGLAAELRASSRAVDQAEQRERDLADLEQLQRVVLPLLDQLAALPESATWGVWLDALDVLAGRAIARPARVREELAALRPLSASGPVTLEHVARVLGPALRELRQAPSPSASGRVFCAEVEHVRGLSFDLAIVLGLAEKVFPEVVREDPLLLDGAREAISDALQTNASRTLAERLKLRLALGAAHERIVLCYPRMDLERGRPRVPSFYGLEALRAAEGKLPSYEALRQRAEAASPARLGWPAPLDPARSIDAIEHDLACLRELLPSSSEQDQGAARYLLNVNPHLGRALRFRAYRWAVRAWKPADGLIDPSPSARKHLQEKLRLTQRAYAPTALEGFAACPYRFYVRSVLGLRARVEPAPIEDLSPIAYGALMHEAIAEFLRRVRAQWPLVGEAQRASGAILLGQCLADVAARFRDELAPAVPRVFEDAVAAIGRDLQGWLERFGGTVEWRPSAIEESLSGDQGAGVELENGLRVHGRVDLIEERADDALRVTDFKTGKIEAPSGARVHGGAMLQPLVYALALERLKPGRTVVAGRLVGVTAKSEHVERAVPLDANGRASAMAVLTTIDRAIQEGFLPAAPAKDACERCELLALCGPYEPERTARKEASRLEPLVALRRMP